MDLGLFVFGRSKEAAVDGAEFCFYSCGGTADRSHANAHTHTHTSKRHVFVHLHVCIAVTSPEMQLVINFQSTLTDTHFKS